jgi:hypothetical protein
MGHIIAHNREVTGRLSVVNGTATLTVNVKNVKTGSVRSVSRSAPITQFFALEQAIVPDVAKLICAKLPARFDGTWTRTYTNPQRGSWQVTITGSASFVRPANPGAYTDESISYVLASSSVTWTASGSQNIGGGCTYTFSGSGSDSPPPAPLTMLTLEDVTNRSEAPKPEATPFYYAIWVMGNEREPHEYDVTSTCPDGSETFKDDVPLPYAQIGFRDWWSGTPPEIIKSADPTVLEGSRTRQSSSPMTTTDTWKFTGSD